ncbi:MAG: hypothetical protein HY329_06995 [Chloroflexi bacterium]|nr:hypothetical protein [Chloroflexota bacterium]
MTVPAFQSSLVPVARSLESINELYMEHRWGDGLPVVPPTQERVGRMLRYTDRDPQAVVADVAPGFGAATVEKIAINSVLAGCKPEYLPLVIAGVEAACTPDFNLQGVQSTTNPVCVALILNGPAATQLGVNAGYNCMGQGNWANATIGRALRLVLQNVGRALPGDMDRATHGQPGKYSFCFAENEAANPWEPLHVEKGFDASTSAVTAVAVGGTVNMLERTPDADELLRVFADSMAFPTSNDYNFGGEPWIVLGPEHAELLAQAGHTKTSMRERLWELSKLPGARFSRATLEEALVRRRTDITGGVTETTLVPISMRPEDIWVVVAGGPSIHSVYLPSFGDARASTRPVLLRDGTPQLTFGQPLSD